MTGSLVTRLVLGAVGVLVGVYGAYLLLRLGGENLVATLTWLVGGVVLHDGVLGVVLVAAGLLVVRLVQGPERAPVAAGLVVLGAVTATAVPVLGRFGARPDNPTLLDRPYLAGWAVFGALVLLATAAGVVRARRRTTPAIDDVVREPHEVTREPHDERAEPHDERQD